MKTLAIALIAFFSMITSFAEESVKVLPSSSAKPQAPKTKMMLAKKKGHKKSGSTTSTAKSASSKKETNPAPSTLGTDTAPTR